VRIEPADIIHVAAGPSIPIVSLSYGKEYTVDIGEGRRLKVVRLPDGVDVSGDFAWITAQRGDEFVLYKRGEREVLPVVKVGDEYASLFYERDGVLPIAAFAALDTAAKRPSADSEVLPYKFRRYKVMAIEDMYIAVGNRRGDVVAAKAGCARQSLLALGPRYSAGEESGHLSPVYATGAHNRQDGAVEREYICLTCIREFKFAVVIMPIFWYDTYTVTYYANVITDRGFLYYVIRHGETVPVPGYGDVDPAKVKIMAERQLHAQSLGI